MNQKTLNTISTILTLLPAAEQVAFSIGSAIVRISTKDVTREDLAKALEESTSDHWPELSFQSPVPGE